MRSNASIFMALFLLAGCGGGRGYAEAAPESAGSQPMGSLAARSWSPREGGPPSAYREPPVQQQAPPQRSPDYDDQSTETWRAADGSIRSRPVRRPPVATPGPQDPEPQPQWTEPQQAEPQQTAPGASYPAPGTGHAAPAPVPARQQMPAPAPQGYADPAAGAAGPRGSSQPGPGEAPRYDEIGYAGIRPVSGGGAMDEAVVAVHRSLPANSYVEVTSLDTGRTILVLVTGSDPGADRPIDLSAGAARLLGASGEMVPVRIRTMTPSPMDQAALRAGRPAAERPDAPQVLVNALRKHLPGPPRLASTPPPSYAPVRAAPPRPAPPAARVPAGRGYYVQVAALSNAGRAQALAQSMGGFVKPGGGLYRVQLGPFATQAQAQAARQRAAGAGYGDARVFAN